MANRISDEEMLRLKKESSIESLTNGFPGCFYDYMNYCRNLEFTASPNYTYLYQLFDKTFI